MQHGFATVTRMTGRGPVLVVAPVNDTSFEAWRPAREGLEGCGPLWTTEWLVHSKALQVRGPDYLAKGCGGLSAAGHIGCGHRGKAHM